MKTIFFGICVILIIIGFILLSSIQLVDIVANHFFNQVIQIELNKHRIELYQLRKAFRALSQDNVDEEQFRKTIIIIAKIINNYGEKKIREIYGVEE